MKDFSNRLKAERNKKKKQDPKWTQEYVADLIGVARTTYTAYERGTKQPPMETVTRLADLFDVSTDFLIGRPENKTLKETKKDLDSLEEINKLIKQYGIEQFGFFDIEKWRNLSTEDLEKVRSYFEFIAEEAKKRNERKD